MLNVRRTRRRAGAFACAACLTLAIVACGDSADENDTADEARATYVSSIDEICARTTAEIEAETQERLAAPTASTKQLRRIVTDVSLPLLRTQYEDIAALEPPAGDEEEVAEIIAAADSAISGVERDPDSILVVVGEPTPFDEVSGLLADFGITRC